jgi:GNAT superfamily N-acetyltransferase
MREGDQDIGFQCGQHHLDRFFAHHALPNSKMGIGKTFVMRSEVTGKSSSIKGFYTLSMASVRSKELTSVLEAKLPRYPMPVALIGRLAVSIQAQGQGLGGVLLVDALDRIAQASWQLGCVGVIVDAKTEAALSFYQRYGFVALSQENWPRRMFIAMDTVYQALGIQGGPS